MILLLSNTIEETSDLVSEWLFYKEKDFIRINHDVEKVNLYNYSTSSDEFTIETTGNKKINLSIVKSFWFWRGNFTFQNITFKNKEKKSLIDHIMLYERKTALEFIYLYLNSKAKSITNIFFEKDNNKPYQIFQAKLVGLNTPSTVTLTVQIVVIKT